LREFKNKEEMRTLFSPDFGSNKGKEQEDGENVILRAFINCIYT
jgi:hypothetical protein